MNVKLIWADGRTRDMEIPSDLTMLKLPLPIVTPVQREGDVSIRKEVFRIVRWSDGCVYGFGDGVDEIALNLTATNHFWKSLTPDDRITYLEGTFDRSAAKLGAHRIQPLNVTTKERKDDSIDIHLQAIVGKKKKKGEA